MANHKSAIKRIRSSQDNRARNRFDAKTTRSFLKKIKDTSDKKTVAELLPKASSLLDKLVKKNVIHKNKAANLKSQLAKRANSL